MKKSNFVILGVIIGLAVVLAVIWRSTPSKPPRTITIGAVLPMTGDAAKYGKWTQQGAQLAADEINAKGGLNGSPLALKVQDSQTTPSGGVSAFLHLLTTEHPPVVLTTLTGVSRALSPIAESNRVVLFANATLPGLTDGHSFVFRNVTSLASDVPAMVDYAVKVLAKPTIAVLWRNDEFGVWGSQEFSRVYSQRAGTVANSLSYEPKADDFRTHITRIAETNPKAVYLLGYSEVGKIARQAWELGHKWQFLGITTMGDPEAIRLAGGALEGAVFTEPSFSPSNDPKALKFKRDYRARFGEDPEVWAATFYDAVNIVVAAWGSREATAENLREGILKIHDFPGVTGVTSFLPNGDVLKRVELKQIREGKPAPLTQ